MRETAAVQPDVMDLGSFDNPESCAVCYFFLKFDEARFVFCCFHVGLCKKCFVCCRVICS